MKRPYRKVFTNQLKIWSKKMKFEQIYSVQVNNVDQRSSKFSNQKPSARVISFQTKIPVPDMRCLPLISCWPWRSHKLPKHRVYSVCPWLFIRPIECVLEKSTTILETKHRKINLELSYKFLPYCILLMVIWEGAMKVAEG